MADPTSCTRFGSALSKKAQIITAQNQPGSDLDDVARFWPDVSGLEASRCARIIGPGSGRLNWPTVSFPLLESAWRVQIILCETSLYPSGFWQTVRF